MMTPVSPNCTVRAVFVSPEDDRDAVGPAVLEPDDPSSARRDRTGGSGGGRARAFIATCISARATCMPRHTCGPPAKPRFGFGGAVRIEAVGVVPAVGVAVRRAEVHLDDRAGGDRRLPHSSTSLVTRRRKIGSVGSQRMASSMARRSSSRSSRTASSSAGSRSSATSRMPSWRHVVPEPGGEDQAGEAEDLVVGEEWRSPSSSISLSTSIVMTSSCGCSRRSSMTRWSMAVERSWRAGVVRAGSPAVAPRLRGSRAPPRG